MRNLFSALMRPYTEGYIMFKRQMLITFKSPDTIITALMVPAILMFVFTSVFGGAMDVGDYSYVNFIVFAVIINATCQASGILAAASFQDMKTGMIERFRSMPVTKLSFLIGHVLAGMMRNIFAVAIMLGIAFVLGFRTTAGLLEWGYIALILILFITALAWLALLISVSVNSVESAAALPALIALAPFLSSGFAPIETLPGWLQVVARANPVTLIIDALRALAFGGEVGNLAYVAMAWCVGLALVFQLAGLGVFYKRLAV